MLKNGSFQADLITVMHFLLASRKKITERLQLIQNSAARLLSRTERKEHISTVLAALHWLPVTFRIDFKVLLLTYKALNELGPSYIANSLVNYLPSRTLRSSAAGLLEIPATAERKSGTQPLSITPQTMETLLIDTREAAH